MFTALAVGLGLTASLWAQVPNYVPTNGLVGWWPFNGNANDESGNGNNGTVNGATLTIDRFGNASKAYSFDGVNDQINVSNPNNFNFGNNFSVSIWHNDRTLNFQSSTQGRSGFLISKAVSGTSSGYWFSSQNNNFGPFSCNNPQKNMNVGFWEGSSCNPTPCIDTLIWQNIVYTIQNGIYKVFLNGALVESSVSNPINISSNTSPLIFGFITNPLNNDGRYNGNLDDLGIWNRALTECEVADLYNAQLGSFSNSSISINPTSSAIGSNATLTVTTPIQNLQWQSNPGNMGWNNVVNNNTYSGSNNDTLVVSNLQLSNHNQPFRVLACGDTSNIATIQIADTCITNVTVYDTLLTTVSDTLIINTTLSLPAPNNENTILIYPNPASDHITIDNGNFAAMAGYSIKIENNAGQQVFQSAINQAQFYVDLSTWTGNGLYFVHLIDPQNNTVTVRKIVLQ